MRSGNGWDEADYGKDDDDDLDDDSDELDDDEPSDEVKKPPPKAPAKSKQPHRPVSNLGAFIAELHGDDAPVSVLLGGVVLPDVKAGRLATRNVTVPDRIRVGRGRWHRPDQLKGLEGRSIVGADPKEGQAFTTASLWSLLGRMSRGRMSRRVAVVSGRDAVVLHISEGRLFMLDDGVRNPSNFARYLIKSAELQGGQAKGLPKKIDDLRTAVELGGLLNPVAIDAAYSRYLGECLGHVLSLREGEVISYKLKDLPVGPSVHIVSVLSQLARSAADASLAERVFDEARFDNGPVELGEALRNLRSEEVGVLAGLALPADYHSLVRGKTQDKLAAVQTALFIGLATGVVKLDT